MTTDEILARIDQSLVAIAVECERLLAARAQLTGMPQPAPAPKASTGAKRTPSRRSRRARGGTQNAVLEGLDPTEPRTAGDIEKFTGVPRALAGTTLSRLAKLGQATKAERGYLRAT